MNTLTLYIGTDQVLRIPDVTDREGTPQTNATVEVTLRTRAGVEVAGVAWPATATHTANGDYELALADDLAITASQGLEAVVVITLADGSKRTTVARVFATQDTN